MNDIAVELPGDHDDTLGKPQKKRKWDKAKRQYVNVFVDPEGHVIKEKSNKKTVNKLKEKYNQWIKKTHVRIQSAGEMEDQSIVEGARSSFHARRDFKSKGASTQLRKSDRDLKTPEQVLKGKKKELKKKKKFNPERKFDRARRKMQERSAPRRSKMIIKRH